VKIKALTPRRLAIALLLVTAGAALGQQENRSRPLQKNARGLLAINRDFYNISAATGGDYYFWAPGEFAASNLQIPTDSEEVLLSYPELSGKKVFEIPVESGVRSLTVFAGAQRKDLAVLVRPDGFTLGHGGDAVLQSFQHMLIVTVANPAAGVWRLELDGEGAACVTAHVRLGTNAPQLVDFDFVEKGGRPGHEGLFPIRREPRAGEKLQCQLELGGTAQKVQLEFAGRDGSPVGRAELVGDGDTYSGTCTVPKVPFRVMVRGTDANAKPFQRMDRPLLEPKR
jgi:hypothetical protein